MNLKRLFCILLCFAAVLNMTACKHEEPEDVQPELPASGRPDILSEYVFLVDRDSGQVIWDEKSEERIYPASMTKLMTAVLALEHIEDPEETFLFTEEILEGLEEAGANRAGFAPGDEPTLLDLVYGDMLPSGADCSRALAWYIAGSEEAFVELMNEKAQELGMHDTHFVNTSGLFDEDHYSTCRDIAKLMDYCMDNEQFMEVMQTVHYVSAPVRHYPNGLSMDNYVMAYVNQPEPGLFRYLFQIPGFLGGKSGYILESQFSLASAASINGMTLILVTTNAYKEDYYPASISDAADIYTWCADRLAKKTAVDAADTAYTVPLKRSTAKELTVAPAESLKGDYGEITLVPELPAYLEAPVNEGDSVGKLHVYSYDEEAAVIDLVAEESVQSTSGSAEGFLNALTGNRTWIISLLLLAAAGGLLAAILKPGRKRTRKVQ
ncbi:MAG: D-alanyl-D-alanine carboxypeptidase [Solobacterium sp.]|nr:D-alanyl-D-alanine carboxypeptidase [Solobacterium sp.]